MSELFENPFTNDGLINPQTNSLYNEPFLANDGYIYEADFIELKMYNKETIISPTTGKEMKTGGIIFKQFSKYLKQFYKDHPEQISHKYFSDNDRYYNDLEEYYGIVIKESIIAEKKSIRHFDIMIKDEKEYSIKEIIFFVEQKNGYANFTLRWFNSIQSNRIIELLKDEKGLSLIMSGRISIPEISKIALPKIILKNIDLPVLLYEKYFILNNFDKKFLYNACMYARYDIAVKIYNFDNTSINVKHENEIDNVFNAAIVSGNLDIIKFVHEKGQTLYKNIDSFKHSPLEHACINAQFDVIKFLFTIDKNIYIDEPNKINFMKNIKEECSMNDYCRVLEILLLSMSMSMSVSESVQ